jgi:hypothetical protein
MTEPVTVSRDPHPRHGVHDGPPVPARQPPACAG